MGLSQRVKEDAKEAGDDSHLPDPEEEGPFELVRVPHGYVDIAFLRPLTTTMPSSPAERQDNFGDDFFG